MVVGRGQRHRLRDAELAQALGRGVGPLRRVGDRAGGDDRALPTHQAGHRGDGADPTRVGQRDVGALEIVGGELALPRLGDQLLVVAVEGGEVEPLGALDRRHHQAVRPVLALDINGDPKVDRPVLERKRLPVPPLEDPSHNRMLLRSLNDRPSDQVSEGDLHPPLFEQRIERLPLGIERVHGNGPERGGSRNLPALIHQLSQSRRRPSQRLLLTNSGRSRPITSGQHILLGHLSPRSRTANRAKVDAIGFSYPPGNRCRPNSVAPVGAPGRGRLTCGWRGLGGAENGGPAPARRPLRGRGGPRSRPVRTLTRFHLGQRRADRHLVVDGNQQFRNDAIRRRRHLGIDLVGRHLDHSVPLADEVALGNVPLEHDPLGDRLAHFGHRNLHGRRLRHFFSPVYETQAVRPPLFGGTKYGRQERAEPEGGARLRR